MDNKEDKKDNPGLPQNHKKQGDSIDPQIKKQIAPPVWGMPDKQKISSPGKRARRPIPVIPDEDQKEFETGPYFTQKGKGYWKWFVGIILFGVIVWMIPGSVETEHITVPKEIKSVDEPMEKKDILLFMTDESEMGLIQRGISIDLGGSIEKRINTVLVALFNEYQNVPGPFPQEIIVREIFMNGDEPIISIDGAFRKRFMGGGWSELLAVYSLVNTITQNFEQVKAVRILINDQETKFFVSHVSLEKSLAPNMAIVLPDETPDL